MRQFSRRTAVYAAAATTLIGTAGAGLAAPGVLVPSPTTKAQTAAGDVRSGDNFHLVYRATRAKGAPETAARGSFVGEAKVAGQRVVKFGGPITCLYNQGTATSFFYPITTSDPAVVAMFGAGVFINVQTDGKGNATAFSFLPVPAKTTMGCSPLPTALPATGKATATGG